MMNASHRLDGSVAVVTGGAQGIGLETARLLALAGAQCVICDLADDKPDQVEAVVPDALYVQCDVTDFEAVENAVATIIERFGGMHVLVNNAGIAIDALLLRMKPEQWKKTLDVNLNGSFYWCRAALRYLLQAREKGRIVNIASVVGETGNAGQAAYAASKAGLIGLTRTLAREVAARGVTVNAVAPGFVETKMTETHIQGEKREKMVASIPIGRIGDATDVAEAVRFLCLPAARYITGQVLRVNGGMYM